ncbi:unnamed protein product [Cylicostephanus goldi]|uniref:Uncharacterized protein n=1 Tax=Cylicostephanus goldi TaxID=71465 RepID=A0A3P7MEK4_CYLGO|nr:unnamed protein product [Cylicostephanus goldi]
MNGPNHTPRESFGSLADEMADSERSEVMQLRLENRKLRAHLDSTESSIVASAELEQLKTDLEEREKQLSENRAEHELVQRQTNADREKLRTERDESVMSLIDARKKFAQFQSEFGRKFEQEAQTKVMEMEAELQDLRRKLSSAEEERRQTEKQLHRVCDEQKQLRVIVDELREEKANAETQSATNERARRSAETERNSLRARIEALDVECEELRERARCAEDAKRRMEGGERRLAELQTRVGDLEAENRTLQQQVTVRARCPLVHALRLARVLADATYARAAYRIHIPNNQFFTKSLVDMELESQKTQRLREDLVSEKSKLAELVSRLRSVCAAVALNGGKIDAEMDDHQLIDSIDDVIMGALTAAKREADALRLQQHTQIAELNDLKSDIEKLRYVRNCFQENICVSGQEYSFRWEELCQKAYKGEPQKIL